MNTQYYYVDTSSGTYTITLPVNTTVSNTYTIHAINTTGTYIIPIPSVITHTGGGGGGGGVVSCITGSNLPGFTITQQPDYVAVKKEAGCSCKKCDTFNEYAESNQEDGTFICYSCRRGR